MCLSSIVYLSVHLSSVYHLPINLSVCHLPIIFMSVYLSSVYQDRHERHETWSFWHMIISPRLRAVIGTSWVYFCWMGELCVFSCGMYGLTRLVFQKDVAAEHGEHEQGREISVAAHPYADKGRWGDRSASIVGDVTTSLSFPNRKSVPITKLIPYRLEHHH